MCVCVHACLCVYTHILLLFSILFIPKHWIQFLCCTVGPSCPCILGVMVRIHWPQAPRPPPRPPPGNHKSDGCVGERFCFVGRFICVVFLVPHVTVSVEGGEYHKYVVFLFLFLTSLGMIISRSIHIAACGIVLLFFMAEERFVCTTPSLHTHLLVAIWVSPCPGYCQQRCCVLPSWGTFGCLRVSAVVSSAAVRSPVGGHLGISLSRLLGAAPLCAHLLGDIWVSPCLGCCDQHCCGCWGACISLSYGFLWACAQEWGCWVTC